MVRAAIRERNWIEPKLGHAARISDVDMCRLMPSSEKKRKSNPSTLRTTGTCESYGQVMTPVTSLRR
jgi:hypothetical protein